MRDQAEARALREDVPAAHASHLRLVDDPVVPAKTYREADGDRRTVVITGQPVPARRRPSSTSARLQARPDRIALWAVLLGLFLVFMAVATAQGSV